VKRLPPAAVLLVAALVAAVCVRLGFWQLSRLHEKQSLNQGLRSALSAPPLDLAGADAAAASRPETLRSEALRRTRYFARGRYDESRQFLLMGRARDGDPGVEVVTPLLPDDGSAAVLVNRGWIPSIDAATAQPERFPAAGERTIVGLAEPIVRGIARSRPTPYLRVEIDSLHVWSTPRLDADSVEARLPYRVRPYLLRALPDAADSLEVAQEARASAFAGPLRPAVRFYDETVHVSYAGQWFAFAAIALIGSIVLVVRGRARATALPDSP
jgi:surfeit locus 1 family protein